MAKKHIITVGGLPGSGKSTVTGILGERLGYDTFSTGNFTRQMAIERNMSLDSFIETYANAGDIDAVIDAELGKIEGTKNNMVVDSRLGFHFIPSSFKVFLEVTPEQSAERIFNDAASDMRKRSGDTDATLEEAYMRTKKRIANDKERYRKLYGVNPYDTHQYDLVVDAAHNQPEEIATMILDAYSAWLEEA